MPDSAGTGKHSWGCYNGETTYYATENADNDSTIITGMGCKTHYDAKRPGHTVILHNNSYLKRAYEVSVKEPRKA